MTDLHSAVKDVAERLRRHGSRGLNEENTKATPIDEVLRALASVRVDLDFPSVPLPSAAAAARATIIGRRTNGWTFWRVSSPGGKEVPLASLRERYERRSHLKVVG